MAAAARQRACGAGFSPRLTSRPGDRRDDRLHRAPGPTRPTREATDAELVELYRHHHADPPPRRGTSGMVRRILRHDEDAADVVQSTWVGALTALDDGLRGLGRGPRVVVVKRAGSGGGSGVPQVRRSEVAGNFRPRRSCSGSRTLSGTASQGAVAAASVVPDLKVLKEPEGAEGGKDRVLEVEGVDSVGRVGTPAQDLGEVQLRGVREGGGGRQDVAASAPRASLAVSDGCRAESCAQRSVSGREPSAGGLHRRGRGSGNELHRPSAWSR